MGLNRKGGEGRVEREDGKRGEGRRFVEVGNFNCQYAS